MQHQQIAASQPTNAGVDTPAPPPILNQLVSMPPIATRDKTEDRKTPRRSGLLSPKRAFVNPLYFRRLTGSSINSDNDSAPFRRITSAVSNPDDKTVTKYLVRTPKALDSDSDPASLSRSVIKELCKEAQEGGRAPSPRPSDAVQLCVERNKQMQVWEDYMALTHGVYENEPSSFSFRRTDTLSAPDALPKALEPQDMDDSDVDDEYF